MLASMPCRSLCVANCGYNDDTGQNNVPELTPNLKGLRALVAGGMLGWRSRAIEKYKDCVE